MCLKIVRFFGVVPIVLPLRHVFFLLVFSRPLCFRSKERESSKEFVSFYAQNKEQNTNDRTEKKRERREISNLRFTILNVIIYLLR